MKPLREATGDLTWVEPSDASLDGELRAGDGVVASLRYGAPDAPARAETVEGSYVFVATKRGFLRRAMEARAAGSGTRAATAWARGRTWRVRLVDGREFTYRLEKLWDPLGPWALTRPDGTVLLRLTLLDMTKPRPMRLTIERAGRILAELPLLVLLARYLYYNAGRFKDFEAVDRMARTTSGVGGGGVSRVHRHAWLILGTGVALLLVNVVRPFGIGDWTGLLTAAVMMLVGSLLLLWTRRR